MLRWLISKRLDAAEKHLGVPMDYARHILRASVPAFLKFLKIVSASQYRRALPVAPYHVARLAATRDADCGPCVQIVINLAKKDGVPVEILQALLADRLADVPAELADVYRFATAVVRATGEEDALRETLRQRYGEAGLVELAMAISTCREFPTVKRALGYATSCANVRLLC